jgi:hypothetical protein
MKKKKKKKEIQKKEIQIRIMMMMILVLELEREEQQQQRKRWCYRCPQNKTTLLLLLPRRSTNVAKAGREDGNVDVVWNDS